MSSSATGFAELYTKSEIAYLTMVDLNPNDPSCVYSALLYIIKQSKKQNLHTTVVTFDQSLYLKAHLVEKAENIQVVCR